MGRYWWSSDPVRHLRAWARTADYRKITESRSRADDGTPGWHLEAHDLEPCPERNCRVLHVTHGHGRTLAEAADEVLTHLAERALTQARKRPVT